MKRYFLAKKGCTENILVKSNHIFHKYIVSFNVVLFFYNHINLRKLMQNYIYCSKVTNCTLHNINRWHIEVEINDIDHPPSLPPSIAGNVLFFLYNRKAWLTTTFLETTHLSFCPAENMNP